jgi:hypothetical protein
MFCAAGRFGDDYIDCAGIDFTKARNHAGDNGYIGGPESAIYSARQRRFWKQNEGASNCLVCRSI